MIEFQKHSAALAEKRAAGLASVFYEIAIDEPQRAALLALLERAGEPSELEYWIDMLKGLPAVEAENPGIMHGFCL